MANLAYNCSISKQDCAIHNPLYSYNHGFTSSSCVSYRPWYTGDVGICGWAGAPCTIFGNVSSNCNFPGAAVCVNGSCGGVLGDQCPSKTRFTCNGDINCGDDGKCGGKNADVGTYFFLSDTQGPEACPVEQHCITGLATSNGSCTDPAAPPPPGSLGSPYGNKKKCPTLTSQNSGAAAVAVGRFTILLVVLLLVL